MDGLGRALAREDCEELNELTNHNKLTALKSPRAFRRQSVVGAFGDLTLLGLSSNLRRSRL